MSSKANQAAATLTPGQIPRNRWISFVCETLAISIDLTEKKLTLPTEIHEFHNLVKLYSVYTKTCLISVTLPEYSYDVPKSNHSPILFNLVSALNRFPRISRLEVTFRQPFNNSTQLTNASQFYRLDFKGWKLFRKVGAETLEQIHIGSRLDRRLTGWFEVNITGIP